LQKLKKLKINLFQFVLKNKKLKLNLPTNKIQFENQQLTAFTDCTEGWVDIGTIARVPVRSGLMMKQVMGQNNFFSSHFPCF
jgi:hypothetical protein